MSDHSYQICDPELQKSVFNWIPRRYHRGIRNNTTTNPDDVSDYIEYALNEVGDYELTFPPGTYCVSRQLTGLNSVSLAGRGATIRAISDLDSLGGRGSLLYFNQVVPNIKGLNFDLNNKNANAIFVAHAVTPRFERVAAFNIKAGYAGIRGGSNLYGEIDQCRFSGSGRSLDFQKGWEYRTPMQGNPTLTFVSAGVGLGGTITRSSGSWITDNYNVGNTFQVENSVSNNTAFTISSRTATVLTMTSGTIVNEGPTAGCLVSIPSGSYYGFHDSVISRSILYGNEGCRLADYIKLRDTDHEHAIYQPSLRNENPAISAAPLCAAICVGEEISRVDNTFHTYEFSGLYMELSEGTVGKERAIGSSNASNAVLFNGGQIYGEVGPKAGSTAIFGIGFTSVGGVGTPLLIKRFENAFDGLYSGGSGHSQLTDLTRYIVTSDVTNVFKPTTGTQPNETVRTWGHWADISYTRKTGIVQGPNTAYVIHTISPDTTTNKIDLALGRHWYLNKNTAITIDSTYFVTSNIVPGQEFLFTFANGNITVDNSFIRLRGNANRTFAAGESLSGYVDQSGALRERGY